MQALSSLFLVFALASFALAPGHSPRSFGGIALGLALFQTAVLSRLQVMSYRANDRERRRTVVSLAMGQAASWAFVIGSALLVARNDWAGLGWFVPGVVLAFGFAGVVSWVLLIEINR